MSITTTYNYSSGTGFIYDSSKITFVGEAAQLLPMSSPGNPGQTFTPNISASSYNSNLLTYASSELKQVDQRPSTATFYAAWTSQLNGNWSGAGNGALTVTAVNGAAISAGVLNLTGSSSKYVDFVGTNNTDNTQIGTFEFQVIPNYSGSPAAQQCFVQACTSNANFGNSISIYHQTSGLITFYCTNNAGVQQALVTAAWSPTSGTTYTFLLNYNFTSGSTTLYINGTSILTSAVEFSRGEASYCVVGINYNASVGNANFSILNFAAYSTVVTPASPALSATIYPIATAMLPEFTYAGLGSLVAYTALATTDSGGVAYTMNGTYWNGGAWVASSGLYAQANSASVINANIASFPISNMLQINALYPAQNTQAYLTALTATYTGQAYPTTGPTIAPNSPLTMDSLYDFVDVNTHPTGAELMWFLNLGGTYYWWNGSAWAVSNGTVSQANFAGVIQTNAGSLPITLGAYVTPYAILYSTTGAITPTLSSVMLTYDYFGPMPVGPNVCTIFGYILDEKDIPLVGATVYVENPTTFFNAGIVYAQGFRSATTDSLGYFSITLVETATVTQPLTFSVTYTTPQVNPQSGVPSLTYTFGNAYVPNTPEANITSLTFT